MHPFFLFENLNSLVQPFSDVSPYYRPFILHGEPTQIDLFLVGINPATSVYFSDGVDSCKWVETLMNHQLYHKRYSSNGPTRKGIQGLLNYVKIHYSNSILETNINTYPTDKAKYLKTPSIQKAVIEGEYRFIKVLVAHEPSLIILHGQYTTKHFINLLEKNQWITRRSVKKGMPIKYREQQFPHFTFSYPSGKKGNVFACRHLMYFHKGNSYQDFLNGITPFLKKDLL
ncbi:hypothetical protein ACQKFG_18565 [Peribacillus sp. NPDC076916]|uniref:hypothetical protein n=1 Tax=Peribacillus sp. NPDC076916 TaxID=3390608 RepID=UPI003D0160BD